MDFDHNYEANCTFYMKSIKFQTNPTVCQLQLKIWDKYLGLKLDGQLLGPVILDQLKKTIKGKVIYWQSKLLCISSLIIDFLLT